MLDFGFAEDNDSLDPGLRAAFAPVDPGFAHDSALEILKARWGITGGVLLRQEPGDAPERLLPNADSSAMPNRYRVMGEIARGGVGVVLRGHDVDLGRDVALKVLRAEHAENPSLMRRLVDEAQIGGQLQHPGIVPIYELGLDSTRRPFFAMKLVRGRTLAELLAERTTLASGGRQPPDPATNPRPERGDTESGRGVPADGAQARKAQGNAKDQRADAPRSPELNLPRFLAIFEAICHAMAYAHARGVIHRDLKPSNVMVGSFGEVQVVDWGLAKVLSRGGGGANEETSDRTDPAALESPPLGSPPAFSRSEAGSVLGTPAYMAPEQARGEIALVDERSDVFGLGAILCEILTGRPPYEGTRQEILDQARTGRLGSTFERLNRCDSGGELIDLAKLCLDPAPERRPRNAGEVVRIVQTHRETVDARARSAELEAAKAKARVASERRVRRLLLALAGVILLASLLGGRLYFDAEHQKRLGAEASLRANQAELNLERERRARIESALEILVPLESKAQYVLMQAADVADRDLDRWIYLLRAVRQIVSRTAANAPTEPTRKRAAALVQELEQREAQLEARLGASLDPNRSARPAEP